MTFVRRTNTKFRWFYDVGELQRCIGAPLQSRIWACSTVSEGGDVMLWSISEEINRRG